MSKLRMNRPRVKVLKTTRVATKRATAPNSAINRSGGAWAKVRKMALKRDQHLCVLCRAAGRLREADLVDHKRPRSHGGSDKLANLQSLCKPCHDEKSALEARPDYVPPDEPTDPGPEPTYTIA